MYLGGIHCRSQTFFKFMIKLVYVDGDDDDAVRLIIWTLSFVCKIIKKKTASSPVHVFSLLNFLVDDDYAHRWEDIWLQLWIMSCFLTYVLMFCVKSFLICNLRWKLNTWHGNTKPLYVPLWFELEHTLFSFDVVGRYSTCFFTFFSQWFDVPFVVDGEEFISVVALMIF